MGRNTQERYRAYILRIVKSHSNLLNLQWEADRMNGKGTLINIEGAMYSGIFWNGLRHGQAEETFGNKVGIKYECPLGNKHGGIGFCKYVGNYRCGFFHGKGVFECVDGRRYEGEWLKGRRHGEGRQMYLKYGEGGDEKRLFIGFNGSLYRIQEYSGMWEDGIRQGKGKITYINGDILEGSFVNGQPNGNVRVVFAATKKKQWAEYRHGTRIQWLENEIFETSSKISTWLSRLQAQIAEENDGATFEAKQQEITASRLE